MSFLRLRRATHAAKLTVSAVLVGILALSTAGCSTPGSAESDDGTVLRIGVPRNFGYLSTLWARDYQPDGVTFEYSYFPNYTDVLNALNSGNVDIVEGGDVGAIQSYINTGGQVHAVGRTGAAPESQGVLVRPGSGIDSVADLEGKRVVLSTATNYYPAFVELLNQEGLDIDDVSVVDTSTTDGNQAYVQGDADAFLGTDPTFAWIQEETGSDVLATFSGVEGYANFYPYFASADAIKEKPDGIRALLAGLQENIAWATENPDDYAELLSEKLGYTESAMRLSVDRAARALEPIDDDFLKREADWLEVYGDHEIVTDPDVDLADVFITDFNDAL